jgi:hypothetical protein
MTDAEFDAVWQHIGGHPDPMAYDYLKRLDVKLVANGLRGALGRPYAIVSDSHSTRVVYDTQYIRKHAEQLAADTK